MRKGFPDVMCGATAMLVRAGDRHSGMAMNSLGKPPAADALMGKKFRFTSPYNCPKTKGRTITQGKCVWQLG